MYPYFQDGQRQQPTYPFTPSYPPFFPGSYPPGQGGYPSYPPPGQGGYPPSQIPGGQQGPPQGPPPPYTPQQPQFTAYAVDPGGIRRCLYRYTYVWLQNGRGFWFYPIYVGRTSVAGYRWRRNQNRWVYTGLDLNTIVSYECS